jgi:hypothetical protein
MRDKFGWRCSRQAASDRCQSSASCSRTTSTSLLPHRRDTTSANDTDTGWREAPDCRAPAHDRSTLPDPSSRSSRTDSPDSENTPRLTNTTFQVRKKKKKKKKKKKPRRKTKNRSSHPWRAAQLGQNGLSDALKYQPCKQAESATVGPTAVPAKHCLKNKQHVSCKTVAHDIAPLRRAPSTTGL